MKLSRSLGRVVAPALAIALVGGVGVAVAAPSSSSETEYKVTLEMSECDLMAVGVTGSCIRSLQTWLNISDGANLVVDGVFGPETKSAVIHFQKRFGLVPDGIFGDNSRNALKGWYYDMTQNSVPTPRPGAPAAVPLDSGRVEEGLNSGMGYTVVTAIACGGVGLVAGFLTTPAGGFGASLACDILLDD
ncbi:peptidoglycan-binding protein [Streptomyces sp. NPDC057474]|uniref:peptidoglycan-binding domain-containing protein n=1 Tax=Streptomyces sp. NPDC057474 TaxID=3346144 RepID=UPI003673A035